MSVTVSIVNHGHCDMIIRLINQLSENCPDIDHLVLTNNIYSKKNFEDMTLNFQITVLDNLHPCGFASNHNKAFQICRSDFFCVLNPDIIIDADPFVALLKYLDHTENHIIGPKIYSVTGELEDSARYFPSPWSLLKKLLYGDKGLHVFSESETKHFPDWIGGMFILCRSSLYRKLKGFDEDFFLYYEDIDFA